MNSKVVQDEMVCSGEICRVHKISLLRGARSISAWSMWRLMGAKP